MSTIRKTPVAYVTMLYRQREPLIFISSIIYTLYAIRPISRVMSLSDHLSRPYVAIRLERPTWKHDGQPYRFRFGLASNGVYMCPFCYHNGGSLLHCLSTLTPQVRRFISVALVWESPPPDVIRHPALRSPDFPRLNPFVCSAAITWPGCASAILARFFALVKKFHPTILHIKAASTDKFS